MFDRAAADGWGMTFVTWKKEVGRMMSACLGMTARGREGFDEWEWVRGMGMGFWRVVVVELRLERLEGSLVGGGED